MANILYGVNGEGAGHSTRAKEVIAHLQSHGHNVFVASFDRGLQNLRDCCDVTEVFGFRFSFLNNRIRYKRTVIKNLATMRQAVRSVKCLNELKKNAISSSSSPISSRLPVMPGTAIICLSSPLIINTVSLTLPLAIPAGIAAMPLRPSWSRGS